ncbi:MAG: NADP-dependent phosphogluconate dehydrogenase [Myxococcales bacterium]|nr:NADP-dependent phosphogluconate dehydrogenase [Myxococcales bacterium]
MSEEECDVAVVGLGVMGANLARNLARNGQRVAVQTRKRAAADRLAAAHPEAGFRVVADAKALATALVRPRRIVLLVPAGHAVDDVLDALDPWLEPGDLVIDGGNSLYSDTDARQERAATRPWDFIGMGVSGGEQGALLGPSLMPGGDEAAWPVLRPLLGSIAADSDSGRCVTWCGNGSAGHFVKMVHNGIEYGDMQLIAETATLLRRGLGLDAARVADVFDEWNQGELDSFLIEITAGIFRTPDPAGDGEAPLLDAILDAAGQKGTGRWTVRAALELAVAVPTVAAAVDARVLSSAVALRARAEQAFGGSDEPLSGVAASDLRDALYASKIASYAQGFALLRAGSEAYGYGTDLAEVARIWKAGCIIRARFLDAVREAFADADAAPELLALAEGFRRELAARLPAWRRVVSAAARAGIPAPGLAASLAWFDTLKTARGSANLIQAQRDWFGSHGYERRDQPGVAVHTDWTGGSE